MEISSDLISSLNKIKATIDEKDQAVWSSEARSKCKKTFFWVHFYISLFSIGFREATQQLKNENGRLKKDIERMNKEIEELKPLVKMVDEINNE